jgi:hypothetical protein
MHFSTEGEISIGLGLLALLGSGAIMIFPTHLWIGWTMVIAAIVGFLLLVLEHYGLWAMKTVPAIGIAISAPALLVCLIWYFWLSPNEASNPADITSALIGHEPILPIGSLRFVMATLNLERGLHETAGQIKAELHNDTDKTIFFHAVTAGNINGVAFDANKVEFDGYAPPHQSSYLLSKRLTGLHPMPQKGQNDPSFRGIYEYDLHYRYADSDKFSRRTAMGIDMNYWPALRDMKLGDEIVEPVDVRLYNQIEE